MQSGISASLELQNAFGKFVADKSLFALPITINKETLQPLEPVPFTSSDFNASLSSLSSQLQPKTPIYLILRHPSSQSTADLVAITFIPYNSPVRSKTLFAATRSTLVRDLGVEKFFDTLFVTEAEEVLDPAQWDERAASAGADTTILSTEERELQSVKRAEEEERHGTSGRDLMGEGGSGTAWSGGRSAVGSAGSSGVTMKITEEAKAALNALKDGASGTTGGHLVQFGIDLSTETLSLLSSATDVSPAEVPKSIPTGQPSYSFFHFPQTMAVIFIYTCPGTAKVKERMVYASSRNGVIEIARQEGVIVKSKLEAGSPEDITEHRLEEEAGVNVAPVETAGATARQGFARPKRPGRR